MPSLSHHPRHRCAARRMCGTCSPISSMLLKTCRPWRKSRCSPMDHSAKGTRWLETRKMYGKLVTEEMWVSEFEPHKIYLVKAGTGIHPL